MSVVSVSPGDVVSTAVGVLHVESVIVERSREGESFAVSGVAGDGEVRVGVPVSAGVVPLGVDASDAEALVWFNRESRLKRLSAAVFSPGDSARALSRFAYPKGVGALSLTDREPVDAVVRWLGEVEASLVEASAWVEGKRMECLRAFEDFYAGWLKYQDRSWVEPDLDEYREYRKWAGVKLVVGGIYQFQRKYEGHGYFKVVDNKHKTGVVLYGGSGGVSDREGLIYDTDRGCVYLRVMVGDDDLWIDADTVKLLPVSSFEDIDSYLESSKYEGVSLPDALQEIFLDMFCAGEGKPECLPAREELDGNRYCWADDYARCRGVLMAATADLLFDIEKSVGYVRWLREQLVGFYRELGFTI
jgi:hypothetical protein